MTDTEQRFNDWIKTQNIVIREVSTDGGQSWMQVTVEPTELARAAWIESARQNSAADDSPSPFREPFKNPASGMGIRKS